MGLDHETRSIEVVVAVVGDLLIVLVAQLADLQLGLVAGVVQRFADDFS